MGAAAADQRLGRPLGSYRGNRPPRPGARLHPVADHAAAGRGAQGCTLAGRHSDRDEIDGEPGPRRDRRVDRGPGDRQEGKRILGEMPRLQRGEGYLWAPGHGLLNRVEFPAIRTFDSSRTPKRGERLATPRTVAEVDLTAIVAALAAAKTEDAGKPKGLPRTGSGEDRRRHVQLERELAAAKTRVEILEQKNRELNARLEQIAALAASPVPAAGDAAVPEQPRAKIEAKPVRPLRVVTPGSSPRAGYAVAASGDGVHPAARKLLIALAQHAPARFTWGQAATLAGLKSSGGHFNAGRKSLREIWLYRGDERSPVGVADWLEGCG